MSTHSGQELAVRVHGIRGLSGPFLQNTDYHVYCKVSFRNLQFRTTRTLVKVQHDLDNAAVLRQATFEPNTATFETFGVNKLSALGNNELVIIRVKGHPGPPNSNRRLFSRDQDLGIVSIHARQTAHLSTNEHSIVWYPLAPYHNMDSASGQIAVSVFMQRISPNDNSTPIPATRSVSAPLRSPLRSLSPTKPTPVETAPNDGTLRRSLTPSSVRSDASSRTVPGTSATRALGLTVGHRTQDSLVSLGADPNGLNPTSPTVQREGTWDLLQNDGRGGVSISPAGLQREVSVDTTVGDHHISSQPEESARKEEHHGLSAANFAHKVLDQATRATNLLPWNWKIEMIRGGDTPSQVHKKLSYNYHSVFKVEIVEARGLLPADRNGLSDPYCIVQLNNDRRRTKVVPKTLAPQWRETFIFGGDTNPDARVSVDDILHISVFDRDLGVDDPLGSLRLPIWALLRHLKSAMQQNNGTQSEVELDSGTMASIEMEKPHSNTSLLGELLHLLPSRSFWFPLEKSPGMKRVRGELKLRVSFHHAKHPFGTVQTESTSHQARNATDTEALLDSIKETELDQSMYGEEDSDNDSLGSLHPPTIMLDTPSVATHENGTDFISESNMFAETELDDGFEDAEEFNQKLLKKQSIQASTKQSKAHGLRWTTNKRNGTKPSPIRIPSSVRAKLTSPRKRTNKLSDESEQTEHSTPWCLPKPKVTVRVIQARELLGRDGNSKSTPYVLVKCRDSVLKSTSIPNNLFPVWNASFEFGGTRSSHLLDSDICEVFVMDQDKFSKDDFLGYVSFPLWSILHMNGQPHWHQLWNPKFSDAQETRANPLSLESSPTSQSVAVAKTSATPGTVLSPLRNDNVAVATAQHISHSQTQKQDSSLINKYLGEIQIQINYFKPDTTEHRNLVASSEVTNLLNEYKLYNGKVWFYELVVTQVEGSGFTLHPGWSPKSQLSFSLSCGQQSYESPSILYSSRPKWTSRYEFTRSAVPDHRGIGRYDSLSLSIDFWDTNHQSKGQARDGEVHMDVSYLLDRVGYVSMEGKRCRLWFPIALQASSLKQSSSTTSVASRYSDTFKHATTFTTSTRDENPVQNKTENSPVIHQNLSDENTSGSDNDDDLLSHDALSEADSGLINPVARTRSNESNISSAEVSAHTTRSGQSDSSMKSSRSTNPRTVSSSSSLMTTHSRRPSPKVGITFEIRPIGETRYVRDRQLVVRVHKVRGLDRALLNRSSSTSDRTESDTLITHQTSSNSTSRNRTHSFPVGSAEQMDHRKQPWRHIPSIISRHLPHHKSSISTRQGPTTSPWHSLQHLLLSPFGGHHDIRQRSSSTFSNGSGGTVRSKHSVSNVSPSKATLVNELDTVYAKIWIGTWHVSTTPVSVAYGHARFNSTNLFQEDDLSCCIPTNAIDHAVRTMHLRGMTNVTTKDKLECDTSDIGKILDDTLRHRGRARKEPKDHVLHITFHDPSRSEDESIAQVEIPISLAVAAGGRLSGWFPLQPGIGPPRIGNNHNVDDGEVGGGTNPIRTKSLFGGASLSVVGEEQASDHEAMDEVSDSSMLDKFGMSSPSLLPASTLGGPEQLVQEEEEGTRSDTEAIEKKFSVNLSHEASDVQLSLEMVDAYNQIRPVVGYLSLSLHRLKLLANGFESQIRVLVQYGERWMATRTFKGDPSPSFGQGGIFRFPVYDNYTPLVIKLVNMASVSTTIRPPFGPQVGRVKGSVTLSLFEIIEWQAQTANSGTGLHSMLQSPIARPLKLSINGASRVKEVGVLKASISYETHVLGGVVSPNPSPVMPQGNKLSFANARHELVRFFSIMSWAGDITGGISHLLNWRQPVLSASVLVFITLVCVLDSWNSRALACVPIFVISRVLIRYEHRSQGTFGLQYLKHQVGNDDVKARLRVTVVKARSLVRLEDSHSQPLARIYLAPSKENRNLEEIGATSYVKDDSGKPCWSTSPAGFKAQSGSTLVTWETPSKLGRCPAFERHLDKTPQRTERLRVRLYRIRGLEIATALDAHCTVEVQALDASITRDPGVAHERGKSAGNAMGPLTKLLGRQTSVMSNISQQSDGLYLNGAYEVAKTSILPRTHWLEWNEDLYLNLPFSPRESQSRIHIAAHLGGSVLQGDIVLPTDPALLYTSQRLWLPLIEVAAKHPNSTMKSFHNSKLQVRENMRPELLVEVDWVDVSEIEITPQSEEFVESLEPEDGIQRVEGETWKRGGGELVIEVEDASERGRVGFRGRAVLELKDLITKTQAHVQPVVEEWIKLSLRFDGSNADQQLLREYRERIASKQHTNKIGHSLPATRKSTIVSMLSRPSRGRRASLGALIKHGTSRAESETFLGQSNESDETTTKPSKHHQVIGGMHDTLRRRVSARLFRHQNPIFPPPSLRETDQHEDSADTADIAVTRPNLEEVPNWDSCPNVNFEYEGFTAPVSSVQGDQARKKESRHRVCEVNSAIFGEVLVRAQLVLPDATAEVQLEKLRETKRADAVNPLERYRIIEKKLKEMQTSLANFNNTCERFKNLFTWAHPRKTQFVLSFFIGFLVVCLLVPSRFIILFITLFAFTEHFRPFGKGKTMLMHIVALCPTDEDLKKIFDGPMAQHLGSTTSTTSQSDRSHHHFFHGSGDEASDVEGDAEELKVTLQQRFQGIRRVYNKSVLLLRAHHKVAQSLGIVVSRSDCVISGHLRMLEGGHLRGKVWRRYYFAVCRQRIMFWVNKEDLQVKVAMGVLPEVDAVEPISLGSDEQVQLEQHGCVMYARAFVLRHNVASSAEGGTGVTDDHTTILVASTTGKCHRWVQSIMHQCVLSREFIRTVQIRNHAMMH